MDKLSKDEKLRNLVGDNVLKNESMLVGDLLNEGKFNFDDTENLYAPYDNIAPTLNCQSCGKCVPVNDDELCEDDASPQEIMEWWSCTDWLIEKLAKKGEPILRTDYGDYWGRTCTGQAIYMDGVIEEIYNEMMK